jgi:hypothetical protein
MSNVVTHSKKQSKPKHTKRTLIIVLAVLLVIVVLPTTALAYMGFVPVATEIVGTNKPVDLGVKYSVDDFKSLEKKTLLSVNNYDNPGGSSKGIGVPEGAQLVIYGTNTIQATPTQEELTAFLNLVPWTVPPVSNTQIRV